MDAFMDRSCICKLGRRTIQARILSVATYCFSMPLLTACNSVFKVITLVWDTQGNYFENAIACSKHAKNDCLNAALFV